MRRSGSIAAALVVSLAIGGRAAAGPSELGELGFVTLPMPQSLRPTTFVLGSELTAGWVKGARLGPGITGVSVGLPFRLDASLALRDSGGPRDRPRDVGMLLGALKFQILPGAPPWPTFAAQLYIDRLASTPQPGGRLIVGTAPGDLYAAAMAVGWHAGRDQRGWGPEVVGAGLYRFAPAFEALGEVHLEGAKPWAVFAQAGVRWQALPHVSLAGGLRWGILGDAGVRAFVALSFHATLLHEQRPPVPVEEPAPPPHYTSERPAFRLRVPPLRMPGDPQYLPLQPELSPEPVPANPERPGAAPAAPPAGGAP